MQYLMLQIHLHTWIALRWAGWNHAVMEYLVVQCVWPAWRSIFIDWHR